MSAKTFVKINILLDCISIHVGININSDGHQTEGAGSYTIKKLLTIRFKLKTSSSTKCNILYTFVKKTFKSAKTSVKIINTVDD